MPVAADMSTFALLEIADATPLVVVTFPPLPVVALMLPAPVTLMAPPE